MKSKKKLYIFCSTLSWKRRKNGNRKEEEKNDKLEKK